MPTKLLPRPPEPKHDYAFPLLSMIAALLALILLFGEAYAMGTIGVSSVEPALLLPPPAI